ncbi:uncharacterized protein Z518_08920 [Rhinocladiella mackenziei CBS 650.93]|uniref:AB hydrolase-1 domain-containing protein n=1 Tax=Rhinocladiella mackenziei CBS 650.93 TaxID=1442369 RepID=A0A0D2IX60_9EURO|nr:uncharacterized protein Z518_08920 [Rhinocladiella mackenziei CBS 650.93]KIX01195.1 hypothetical protein Z518_08920 [Rhinocladiella mackenziei CBS 650.93]
MSDPTRFVCFVYTWVTKRPDSDTEFACVIQEFSYLDTTKAVPRYFNSSSFSSEWLDRRNRLLAKWKCPVMILRGFDSKTQPRELYENSKEHIPGVPNVVVEYMPGGHFWTLSLQGRQPGIFKNYSRCER